MLAAPSVESPSGYGSGGGSAYFSFSAIFYFWLFGVGESGKFNSDHRKILEDIGHPQLISSIIQYGGGFPYGFPIIFPP